MLKWKEIDHLSKISGDVDFLSIGEKETVAKKKMDR